MARKSNDKRSDQKSIFDVLMREHLVVGTLLDRIETALNEEDFDSARSDFALMSERLLAHAKAEEKVVYPAFAEAGEKLKELTLEAREEHSLVEDKLKELSALDADAAEWKAKFTVLKELVDHHVDEEEGEVFPVASKEMTTQQAIELAEQFLDTKREIMGDAADSAVPVDLEVMTKEELLEKARASGLENYSALSKAQLVEALADRR